MRPRIKLKFGDCDATDCLNGSGWHKVMCRYSNQTGLKKTAKRRYNKRDRLKSRMRLRKYR